MINQVSANGTRLKVTNWKALAKQYFHAIILLLIVFIIFSSETSFSSLTCQNPAFGILARKIQKWKPPKSSCYISSLKPIKEQNAAWLEKEAKMGKSFKWTTTLIPEGRYCDISHSLWSKKYKFRYEFGGDNLWCVYVPLLDPFYCIFIYKFSDIFVILWFYVRPFWRKIPKHFLKFFEIFQLFQTRKMIFLYLN